MVIDPLPTPEIDPLAELPEVTPYGRLWGPPEDVPCPAPVIMAADTYAAGWCWWPSPVLALEKRAQALGYEVRIGFARGYKPGRRKNTWELWDTIGAWLDKPAAPRVVFTWERSPDQANTWKASTASFRGSNGVMVAGHLAGRKLL
jgi:hypothetical protein